MGRLSEIYFGYENEPFVGKNQSFIIVFGIENATKTSKKVN